MQCSRCGTSRNVTDWTLTSSDQRWHMNVCKKCWKEFAMAFSPSPARRRREFTVIPEDEIPSS